jgi:hypothetical protein
MLNTLSQTAGKRRRRVFGQFFGAKISVLEMVDNRWFVIF